MTQTREKIVRAVCAALIGLPALSASAADAALIANRSMAIPKPMVRADVKSGRLVRLNLHDGGSAEYIEQVVHMMDSPPAVVGR